MNVTKMFPLKGIITEEIIAKADVRNIHACIGALTLQAAFNRSGINGIGRWAAYTSCSSAIEGVEIAKHGYEITTEEHIDFMQVTHPQEVMFILKKI